LKDYRNSRAAFYRLSNLLNLMLRETFDPLCRGSALASPIDGPARRDRRRRRQPLPFPGRHPPAPSSRAGGWV